MAYVVGKKTPSADKITYLPEKIILRNTNENVILDFYRNSDYGTVYEILKNIIKEGISFPRTSIDEKQFENYYLSDDIFVVRDQKNEKVLGAFYIKPNFPGRSSHICKAGFLVHQDHRKKGIGEVLYKKYLKIARDLGYESSLFSLVFATNGGSVKICRKLGFKEIGRVPKAGKLKGLGYVDALRFYYDLTTLDDPN